ncbi:MAG: hypothetical protein AAB494_01635 [Patescibacteria group bacterium]
MDKIKYFYQERKKVIDLFFIIFIVGTLSFGLGFLTNREFSHAPIIIERCSELTR